MKHLSIPIPARNLQLKTLLACMVLSFSQNSFAFMELPFCPAGGPPGWMNYFDHKREQNKWHRRNYPSFNYPPSYYQSYAPPYARAPALSGPQPYYNTGPQHLITPSLPIARPAR